jgi:hypothetical protein
LKSLFCAWPYRLHKNTNFITPIKNRLPLGAPAPRLQFLFICRRDARAPSEKWCQISLL